MDKHEDNRTVVVVLENENIYRSSEIQLDGDKAPLRFTVPIRPVPTGEYEVLAVLYRMGDKSFRRVIKLTVVGPDGDVKLRGRK